MEPVMLTVGNRAGLIGVVALVAAAVAAPSLARGGSGGFIGGATVNRFPAHFGVAHAPVRLGNPHRSIAFIPSRSISLSRTRFLAQPEVIVMPFAFGPDTIVAPLTIPIVAPFGSATVRASRGGLPVVITPSVNTPVFFSGFAGGMPAEAPRITEPPHVTEAPTAPEPETGVPRTTAAAANPFPAACHPVPSGYHCDWPS
jgi:hypothetical protein